MRGRRVVGEEWMTVGEGNEERGHTHKRSSRRGGSSRRGIEMLVLSNFAKPSQAKSSRVESSRVKGYGRSSHTRAERANESYFLNYLLT